MEDINKICRLCLSSQENDEFTFNKISSEQKDKFEEITGIELPLIQEELPVQICISCSDQLENFYFYRKQLIKKQNDLKSMVSTLVQEDEIYEDIEILEEDQPNDNTEYVEYVQENESQNNQLICSICGKIVNTRRDMRSHQRSHSQVKKYRCDFEDCKKAFRYQHHLVNHKRTHTQSSPFQCDECNVSFRQKYALTLHKRKHARNFIECEKCKSQFLMQNQLKRHEESCDGIFRPYVVKPRINVKK